MNSFPINPIREKKYGDVAASVCVGSRMVNISGAHTWGGVLCSAAPFARWQRADWQLSLLPVELMLLQVDKRPLGARASGRHRAQRSLSVAPRPRHPEPGQETLSHVASLFPDSVYLIRCELELFIKRGGCSAQEGWGSQEVAACRSN